LQEMKTPVSSRARAVFSALSVTKLIPNQISVKSAHSADCFDQKIILGYNCARLAGVDCENTNKEGIGF
ncbi:MAG: hypothetical protein WBP91_03745, partial [Terriglobales bacterium]